MVIYVCAVCLSNVHFFAQGAMTNVPPVLLNYLQENGQFHIHTDFAVMGKFKGPVKIAGASTGIECLIAKMCFVYFYSFHLVVPCYSIQNKLQIWLQPKGSKFALSACTVYIFKLL